MVMLHKAQPSRGDIEQIGGLRKLTPAEQRGIAIAAYILRCYGEGELWASLIESHGEQQRARYWMTMERRVGRGDPAPR